MRCQPENFWHVCRQTPSTLVGNMINSRKKTRERERERETDPSSSGKYLVCAKNTDLIRFLSVAVWLGFQILLFNLAGSGTESLLSADWKAMGLLDFWMKLQIFPCNCIQGMSMME